MKRVSVHAVRARIEATRRDLKTMHKGSASARNRSDANAQEKENTSTLPAHLTPALVDLYIDALGITPWRPGWLWRSTWIAREHGRTRVVGRGWRGMRWPLSPSSIRFGLEGGHGVDLREQRSVRYVGIDIDCHDVDGSPAVADLDAWLDDDSTSRRTRRRRERIAARARPVVEAVRAVTPGIAWLVLASPRGVHMVTLLAEPVATERAEQLARSILVRAGAPASVEPFPRAEAGGRTCRLPLTGGSRLLQDDLTRFRHGRRVRDLVTLLGAPRVGVPALGDTSPAPAAPSAPVPPVAPERKPLPATLPTDLPGDADLRERLGRQLRGAEFRETMVELVRFGMPDDASFDAAKKLAALVTYAGIAKADCAAAGLAFIGRPTHRATHARTEQGRKAWMRTFRACLKHQSRGIDSGRVRPGGVRDPELVAVVAELLGREPARRRVVALEPALRAARSAAAKIRWARERGSEAGAA